MEGTADMKLIVAVNTDWGIGYKDQLLVHIKPDLKRFRTLTLGNTVIVGRKTLKTFPGGRPLAGRKTLLLTRNPENAPEGVTVASDIEDVLEYEKNHPAESLFVIGGESVYRAFLAYCDYAYVTKFCVDKKSDRFFPNLDESLDWVVSEAGPIEEYEGISYQYVTYERKRT